jgi:quinol monooxygenase YgiN
MSTPNGITVLARWQMSAGSLEAVLKLVVELKPQTLAEPGCPGYDVFQSSEQDRIAEGARRGLSRLA